MRLLANPLATRKTAFRQQGGVIFITLIIAGVIAATLAAYLTWANAQNTLTTRAQDWNMALPVAEAGIEEAMTHINFSSTWATNGWTLSGTNYTRQRTFSSSSYYLVNISTNDPPIIVSQGFVQIPFQTNVYISRTVVVNCNKQSSSNSAGIAVKSTMKIGGNSSLDSFDSSNPSYSTSGQYDKNKREGHIALTSNSSASGAIDVNSAKVAGTAATGPGGSVSVANNGALGDLSWVTGNNSGVQAGAVTANANYSFPDNPAPFTTGYSGLPSTVGGVYTFVAGNYKIGALSLSSSQKILIAGPGETVIYCDGGISESGGGSVEVAAGASLKLYVDNGSISLTGGGLMNDTGIAANCRIYGMTNCTTVKLGGNAAIIAAVNAPEASLTVAGNGVFCGAITANDVTIGSGAQFHFDEALGGGGSPSSPVPYTAGSWNEY